jgi:hypothetical protein
MSGKGLIAAVILIGWLASPARGYYIDYEGDVFPEDDGWTLIGDSPNPDQYSHSIEDGVYTIDAAAEGGAFISYEKSFTANTNQIIYEWRIGSSNNDGSTVFNGTLLGDYKKSVFIVGLHKDYVDAHFFEDYSSPTFEYICSQLENAPFHIIQIISNGALYSYFIDGIPIGTYTLQDPVNVTQKITWGFMKNSHNIPTTSKWDYVRVNTVPEPSNILMMLGTLCVVTIIFRK